MAQQQSYPTSDSDFSLSLPGFSKDDMRQAYLFFKVGDKYPAIGGKFLKKDGKTFSQAFMTFFDYFSFLDEVEALARFPGEGKISKTFNLKRTGAKGAVLPTGVSIFVSRRSDGAISIQIRSKDVRDVIFPIVLGRGCECETRIEGGEPRDPREKPYQDVLTYIDILRNAGYNWKNIITTEGNIAEKERLREHFNGSSTFE